MTGISDFRRRVRAGTPEAAAAPPATADGEPPATEPSTPPDTGTAAPAAGAA